MNQEKQHSFKYFYFLRKFDGVGFVYLVDAEYLENFVVERWIGGNVETIRK